MATSLDHSTEQLAALANTNIKEFLEDFAAANEIHNWWNGDEFEEEVMPSSWKPLEHPGADLNGLRIDLVYSEGGGEGEGDHVERVFAIKNVDGSIISHFRLTGFYSSNYGTEWDEPSEVERVYPRQVMVTQYFNEPAPVARSVVTPLIKDMG